MEQQPDHIRRGRDLLVGEEMACLPDGKTAFSVRADKALVDLDHAHTATGTFAQAFRLPAIPAREQHFRAGGRLVTVDQFPQHIVNVPDKFAGVQLAALDLLELVFPFSGEQRRLQGFGEDGDQGLAGCGRHKACDLFGFLAFNITRGDQLFQNCGAGGRCSQSLALNVLRHVLYAGCFHGGQDGIFSVMLRWRGFTGLYRGGPDGQGLPFGKLRQNVWLVFFPHRLLRLRLALVELPTGDQDSFALSGKGSSCTGELSYRFGVTVRI